MENNNLHIDDLIRDKFDSFAPAPPEHIWEGIEEGIKSKPNALFLWNKRTLAVAAVVLLALISTTVMIFKPINFGPEENNHLVLDMETDDNNSDYGSLETAVPESKDTEIVDPVSTTSDEISSADITVSLEPIDSEIVETNVNIEKETEEEIITDPSDITNDPNEQVAIVSEINENQTRGNVLSFDIDKIIFRNSGHIDNKSFVKGFSPVSRDEINEIPQDLFVEETIKKSNLSWRMGCYFSPELTVSNIDSVEVLNSFNINVEPSWYFNDHWFIRSGLGVSYVRDRGFARINYVTKEYMGSYDDVYEVTFDTISGNVVPTYHTKTVEVWDSIRHVSVSGVTNKYLYMQIPLMLGYQSGNTNSQINWYVAGGPALNLKISEWIDDPKPAEKDADIIDLENKLPLRANNYFQLWLGAGLEYKINRKILIGFEPSYRYYLNNVYKNTDVKGPTSGFTFRVGLVYLMK